MRMRRFFFQADIYVAHTAGSQDKSSPGSCQAQEPLANGRKKHKHKHKIIKRKFENHVHGLVFLQGSDGSATAYWWFSVALGGQKVENRPNPETV
jgi:hypothetical protein